LSVVRFLGFAISFSALSACSEGASFKNGAAKAKEKQSQSTPEPVKAPQTKDSE
jgi:hypothetical protein